MKLTKNDYITISKIAQRAKKAGHPDSIILIMMDLEHAMPLRLDDLLNADEFNFNQVSVNR